VLHSQTCPVHHGIDFIAIILLLSLSNKHHNESDRAAEKGCKNRFLGFLQKKTKTSKVQLLGFLGYLGNLKNPDFRLTVTAENCCLSV